LPDALPARPVIWYRHNRQHGAAAETLHR
jgi:hypothetical protein